jgi:uncharacterized protein YbjQ (UPF0145 family)
MTNILITTTPTVENRPVLKYLGIVSGVAFTRWWGLVFNDTEEVESVHADTPWGRAWSEFKANLHKARDWAIQQMAKEAESLGANAVIGVKIDYKITGDFSGDFIRYGCRKCVGDRDWDGSAVVGRAGGGSPCLAAARSYFSSPEGKRDL